MCEYVEEYEVRGFTLRVTQDFDAGNPLEGYSAEPVAVRRNERGARWDDPNLASAGYEEPGEDQEKFCTFTYTEYELWGHPGFEVLVNREAVNGFYGLGGMASAEECETWAWGLAGDYARWAEGAVYTVENEDTGDAVSGVYFANGYPDAEELEALAEAWGFLEGSAA